MRFFELKDGTEIYLNRSALVRFPDSSVLQCVETENGFRAFDVGGGDGETSQAARFGQKLETAVNAAMNGNFSEFDEIPENEKYLFGFIAARLLDLNGNDESEGGNDGETDC